MAEPEFTTEELKNEIWKIIPDYHGYYSVSDLGRVRREIAYRSTQRGRILKPALQGNGYPIVSIAIDNKKTTRLVHQLVMQTFVGQSTQQVNHKDGDKQNNRWLNLEYVTPSENAQHAHLIGLYTHGEANPTAKFSDAQVRHIKQLIAAKLPYAQIADLIEATYGLSIGTTTICRIKLGHTRAQVI